jgi:hypothetical protein
MAPFFPQYFLRSACVLLAVVFAASLIWCGDGACSPRAIEDQCASAFCPPHNHQGGQEENPPGHCSAECMCVCHSPTIVETAFVPEHHQRVHHITTDIDVSSPSSPIRAIYHPPKS